MKNKKIVIVLLFMALCLLLTGCFGPEGKYKKAQKLLSKGQYAEAAEEFESLGSYEDATTLTMYCKACDLCESGNYEAGLVVFEQLGEFKDCSYRITYYEARACEDEAGEDYWEGMLEAKAIYQTIPVFLDSAERMTALDARVEVAKSVQYNAAVENGENGNYSVARTAFDRLYGYKDSGSRYTYYGIRRDEDALASSNNQDAMIDVAERYTELGVYLDCKDRATALIAKADAIVAVKYAKIAALIEECNYQDADDALTAFGTYGNEQVLANYYAMGEKCLAEGLLDVASIAFAKAGEYSDAKVSITYCGYRAEEGKLADSTDQDKIHALAVSYANLDGHRDSVERVAALTKQADEIVTARYADVATCISEGKYADAEAILAAFGDYGSEQVGENYYLIAEKYLSENAWEASSAAFKKAGTYNDAKNRILEPYYVLGEMLAAEGKWQEASAAFTKAADYSDAKNSVFYCGYRAAEEKLTGSNDQDKFLALGKNYSALGAHRDSSDRAAALTAEADRIVATRYAEVNALVEKGELKKAQNLLIAFGTYGNQQVPAYHYEIAEIYFASQKWDEALSAFEKAGNYENAVNKINETRCRKAEQLLADGKLASAYVELGKIPKGKNQHDVKNIMIELSKRAMEKISAGYCLTIGLKSDGTAVAAGHNRDYQCNVSKWTDIVAVTAGSYHTVGLKADGTVVTAGDNGKGQCNVNGWKDIVAVAAGSYHTVGLKADGTVVAVGYNTDGQCNVNGWKDIVAVAAGYCHTVGLKADGTVVAVGYNDSGRCNVNGWKDIVAVAAGDCHTVGLKSDGTVVAVGYNKYGQCNVNGWKDIVAVTAGSYHTVGLKADGTVVVAGQNSEGEARVSDWDLLD